MTGKTLEAIKFLKTDLLLRLLDQLKLPYTTSYIEIKSIEDAFQAIKLMQVRGAPAIAITGAFAITSETNKTIKNLVADIDYLITSRPTAVNLSNACNEIKTMLTLTFAELNTLDQKILDALFKYSVKLHEDDLRNNYKIGENGVNYIVETLRNQKFTGPFSIMTICNTGSLATSGHGTALGIIRSVYSALSRGNSSEEFWFEHAYPLETRPYNQGAKLTTYELQYEQIPFTLVCDNMATSLISLLKNGKSVKGSMAPVKFIIAGADRIVKNGDSANKIGTYQLAAIANHFNKDHPKNDREKIKFIIAAPNTNRSPYPKWGRHYAQGNVGEKFTIGVATPGIEVWNPAFDVTPCELIDSIVTEDCAIKKIDGQFVL
ncbi:putative translation initiation factor [Metschnikowia bicuspidata var. bicuspidata NRRL YB-4993]|uniref:Putative translation initiation factor n=1 Tax=Metschnikowia bicuspidata var. bicuspidata NRRL YB-4993 TaxID=869754 RepID=A0A1A0H7M1_9ASCO|nr:putative translation initiation factor [Metschnikowia bicuspidata var. bicuspidata NRRL YB-4993]OBA20094.1 putative translation initiation factor [Metschnikowia bicuspidata var. bicuspidata NRRL YB-4993]